jgi:hypothetical protein
MSRENLEIAEFYHRRWEGVERLPAVVPAELWQDDPFVVVRTYLLQNLASIGVVGTAEMLRTRFSIPLEPAQHPLHLDIFFWRRDRIAVLAFPGRLEIGVRQASDLAAFLTLVAQLFSPDSRPEPRVLSVARGTANASTSTEGANAGEDRTPPAPTEGEGTEESQESQATTVVNTPYISVLEQDPIPTEEEARHNETQPMLESPTSPDPEGLMVVDEDVALEGITGLQDLDHTHPGPSSAWPTPEPNPEEEAGTPLQDEGTDLEEVLQGMIGSGNEALRQETGALAQGLSLGDEIERVSSGGSAAHGMLSPDQPPEEPELGDRSTDTVVEMEPVDRSREIHQMGTFLPPDRLEGDALDGLQHVGREDMERILEGIPDLVRFPIFAEEVAHIQASGRRPRQGRGMQTTECTTPEEAREVTAGWAVEFRTHFLELLGTRGANNARRQPEAVMRRVARRIVEHPYSDAEDHVQELRTELTETWVPGWIQGPTTGPEGMDVIACQAWAGMAERCARVSQRNEDLCVRQYLEGDARVRCAGICSGSFGVYFRWIPQHPDVARHFLYHSITRFMVHPVSPDGHPWDDRHFIRGPTHPRPPLWEEEATIPALHHPLSPLELTHSIVADGLVWSTPWARYMWMYFGYQGVFGTRDTAREVATGAAMILQHDRRPTVTAMDALFQRFTGLNEGAGTTTGGWWGIDGMSPQSPGFHALYSMMVTWFQQYPLSWFQATGYWGNDITWEPCLHFGVPQIMYSWAWQAAIAEVALQPSRLLRGLYAALDRLPSPPEGTRTLTITPDRELVGVGLRTEDQIHRVLTWLPHLEALNTVNQGPGGSRWGRRAPFAWGARGESFVMGMDLGILLRPLERLWNAAPHQEGAEFEDVTDATENEEEPVPPPPKRKRRADGKRK